MKNKTNIYLILSCCAAILAIAGFVYGSYYISGLTAKTTALEGEIEGKEIKIQRIQNTNKSAERTTADRAKLSGYFVGMNDAVEFVSSLESAASGFGLSYSTNAIDNVESETLAAQGKQLLRVSMTLTGAWRNIIKYLLHVESLPYSINIEKVELASEGGSSVPAPTAPAGTSTAAVSRANESKWRLGIVFSVIKIKEKKN